MLIKLRRSLISIWNWVLPLNSALRAAEADLWEPENLRLVIQSGPSSTKRCNPIRKDLLQEVPFSPKKVREGKI